MDRLGDVPLMWILMATSLAFAGTVHGALRGAEYLERKNPLGKLRFIKSHVAVDLSPGPSPNRQQRRAGIQPQGVPRVDRAQLGVQVQNRADFPLSVILERAESEIEGVTPPRTQYPKPAVQVPPGATINVADTRMDINLQAERLMGKYKITLKYGLPGKEHFELTHATTVEIKVHPLGIISTKDHYQPAVTEERDKNDT